MDGDILTSKDYRYEIREDQKWFPQSRYGVFIHWGPYSVIGRGEQVLFREHLDHAKYAEIACEWNPEHFDAEEWAALFQKAGFRYACLTTRHHDGYCLWNTATTDYSAAQQAPKRDFVAEFCAAMRRAGLRVGLYYSWCDWRVPAYYNGPEKDPDGWASMKRYIHTQVEELCTHYGKIDYFFFDGVWPRCAEDLGSHELVKKMREWQPGILINNRLGFVTDPKQLLAHGGGNEEGDFGTPERLVTPENRLWESNQVSTWRWWGYHRGEHWRSSAEYLDSLCTCVRAGGNLLLNVGPKADGTLPEEFCARVQEVGAWLKANGEAVYGNDGGNLTEATSYGYQTMRGNTLYVILRFYDGAATFRLADLTSEVKGVRLLSTGEALAFQKSGDDLLISLPESVRQEALFPVLAIECAARPATNSWGSQRIWEGDPARVAQWAKAEWDRKGYRAR